MARNHFPSGHGPSQRQLRVGELVRRRLSDILLRGDIHDPELNRHSITVGEVRMSPDLRQATAYVMTLGGQGMAEAMADLERNLPEIRHMTARGLDLKYAPRLRFEVDRTFDQMDETRRLLAEGRVRRDIEAGGDDGADDDPAAAAPAAPAGLTGDPGRDA